MCDLACDLMEHDPNDSFLDEFLFLISTTDPWYGYLIIYLQTHRFHLDISRDDCRRICHHTKYCLILNDMLYRHRIESILRLCLTHEEVEQVLNNCHSRGCGSHLFGMVTTQKILRARYFWSSIFKYCHEAVKKFPPCQLFYPKNSSHLAPLHPVIVVGPFSRCGFDFMHFNPTSARGHGYIIVVIN